MTVRSLSRSAPSAQGVDANGVLAFLDAVDAAGVELHSLMLVRHGHVVTEGWWAPYRADDIQLLYSLSKSFTSTAIGMAQAEGLLSIDDAVIGFFPDKVPPGATSGLADLKVRHLLAMASGHAKDTWSALAEGGPDIVRTFLSIPPDHEPGSYFCYNQGCTYTLSAIITRVTGQRLVDYLRPRLFDPLGIEQAHWVQTKEGIDQGFSGLHLTTESVAKLGQLYLQNGFWGGDQLVPESYVAQAHSKQVTIRTRLARRTGSKDMASSFGFAAIALTGVMGHSASSASWCPRQTRSLPALHRLKTCRLRSTSSGSTSSRRSPALPRATWRRRSGWRSACSACQLPPLVPKLAGLGTRSCSNEPGSRRPAPTVSAQCRWGPGQMGHVSQS